MRHGQRAFTLVELMLTMAFFVGLMMTVGGLLRAGLRTHEGWGATLAPYQAYDQALTQLAADVAIAQPFFGMPVIGTATELSLPLVQVVPQPDGTRTAAWVQVAYRLAGGVLTRAVTPWEPGGLAASPRATETLLTDVQGRFQYQVATADGTTQWVDVWDGEHDGVPRFVLFRHAVTLPQGGTLALARWLRNPAGTLPVLEAP